MHRVASLAKRWLLGTHHGSVEPAHLASYLHEFVFRFNRRRSRSRGMAFYQVLELAAAHEPGRYQDLIATKRPRAVPGNVLNGRNLAKVVEDVADILEEIGIVGTQARDTRVDERVAEDPVLRHLSRGESYDMDDRIALSGLDGPRLLPRLLEFEFAGRVARRDGGRFHRTDGGS